jgi:hypothetical protein
VIDLVLSGNLAASLAALKVVTPKPTRLNAQQVNKNRELSSSACENPKIDGSYMNSSAARISPMPLITNREYALIMVSWIF